MFTKVTKMSDQDILAQCRDTALVRKAIPLWQLLSFDHAMASQMDTGHGLEWNVLLQNMHHRGGCQGPLVGGLLRGGDLPVVKQFMQQPLAARTVVSIPGREHNT